MRSDKALVRDAAAEPADATPETTTHVSVHTLHLDGARSLHRQFLRLPDGAIIEVCCLIYFFFPICFAHLFLLVRPHLNDMSREKMSPNDAPNIIVSKLTTKEKINLLHNIQVHSETECYVLFDVEGCTFIGPLHTCHVHTQTFGEVDSSRFEKRVRIGERAFCCDRVLSMLFNHCEHLRIIRIKRPEKKELFQKTRFNDTQGK